MGWLGGDMAGFDLETTGVDVETARIVTAHLNGVDWTVAVDEDIPEAATAIHGITTDYARKHGSPLTEFARGYSSALSSTTRPRRTSVTSLDR